MALLALLVGCGRDEAPPPAPPEHPCGTAAWQDARRDLLDAVGLPTQRSAPERPVLGEREAFEAFALTPIRWAHPQVQGEWVHGLFYEPLGHEGPRPLLLNVHGHWGGGVAADEVNRRAQIFAREGWAVLSIANRGLELGEATPGWRRVHFAEAQYAEVRSRRSGGTSLGWDVVATWAAVDLARAGMLPSAVDPERVAVMGFSGGSERAAVIGATDPRVAAVVLGAHEYAFSSGDGHAGCSCGVLEGAGEPRPGTTVPRRVRWLALTACRPGSPPEGRPVLVWDNVPDDTVDAALRATPGVTTVDVPGLHGVTGDVALRSVAWLGETLGVPVSGAGEAARDAVTAPGYQELQPHHTLPLAPEQPAPGQFEQGQPPWRVDLSPPPGVLRSALGLDAGDPGEALGLRGAAARRVGPADAASAWVVLAEPSALEAVGGLDALRAAAPDAAFVLAPWRLPTEPDALLRLERVSLERGVPPLGVLVHDALAAHRTARSQLGTSPERIGWLGLGAAGVAVLPAATLVGEGGAVSLSDAPVTLFHDGPDDGPAFAPWPAWALVPDGASLDPWLGARALDARVRWLNPRGGDGAPFGGTLRHGAAVDDLTALLRLP